MRYFHLMQEAPLPTPVHCYGGAGYYPSCLPTQADSYNQSLLSLPWETKRTARHEYFMSDQKLSYSYGNKFGGEDQPVYEGKPMLPPVIGIMARLNGLLGTEFNACFLNKYDDDHQHLGWHADDFEGMRADQPIAVVSFGAEREIWLKDKRGFECQCRGSGIRDNGAPCYMCDDSPGKVKGATGWMKSPPDNRQPKEQRVSLAPGSLFVMPVGYQDTHLHRIPKHDRPCGWRISLTFRSFK